MFSLTQNYYKNCAAVILVFDITNRKSFENLEFWMDRIYQNSRNGIKIILLGNKEDLKRKREVEHVEAMRFADRHKIAYEEISAKSGFNSKKFQTIIDILYEEI